MSVAPAGTAPDDLRMTGAERSAERSDGRFDRPAEPAYHQPDELAEAVAGLPRPLVLALDVDGTLAPLVQHPSLSQLVPGVARALATLSTRPGIIVAVVSGRPWQDLTTQFAFGPSIIAVGSHGLERGRPGTPLDANDRRRAARLAMLAGAAAARAPGAWVEHKPAGVALHVRQASPVAADEAVRSFLARLESFGPVEVLPGDEVVEVALRHYDKGEAVTWLRSSNQADAVVFVGDDVTDEFAFAGLGPTDIGIKVGPGDTLAANRLPDPEAVAAFLVALVRWVGGR